MVESGRDRDHPERVLFGLEHVGADGAGGGGNAGEDGGCEEDRAGPTSTPRTALDFGADKRLSVHENT